MINIKVKKDIIWYILSLILLSIAFIINSKINKPIKISMHRELIDSVQFYESKYKNLVVIIFWKTSIPKISKLNEKNFEIKKVNFSNKIWFLDNNSKNIRINKIENNNLGQVNNSIIKSNNFNQNNKFTKLILDIDSQKYRENYLMIKIRNVKFNNKINYSEYIIQKLNNIIKK